MNKPGPDRQAAKRPALRQGFDFLSALVEKKRTSGEPGLPSIQQLAQMAGVSRMTMWQAITALKKVGAIGRGRGRTLAITGMAPGPSLPDPYNAGRRARWRELSGLIAGDLAQGKYLPGTLLPSVKELCKIYGGCYRTVVTALEDLRRRRYIQVHGRTYRVTAGLRRRTYRPYVVLMGFGESGRLALVTPRTHDQIRFLETECAGLGLDLAILTGDYVASNIESPRPYCATLERIRRHPPLGFLFWTVGIWEQRLADIFTFASRFNVPTAILDESASVADVWKKYGGKSWKSFIMAITPTCGEDMGRYLLGLGHRRVAYIGQDRTLAPRFTGLRDAIAHAGAGTVMSYFALEDKGRAISAEHMMVSLRASPSALLAAGGTTAGQAQQVDRMISTLLDHAGWAVQVRVNHAGLWELFTELLAGGYTAWVCDNDILAVECLDFLNEKMVPVPEVLSVTGFDDGITALTYGLTSYNFNGAAVARAMLAHILNPQPGPATTEIPGVVVERRTTGPARPAA